MKKYACIFYSCFVLASIASAGELVTAHYRIITEPGAENIAGTLSWELELRFDAYNRLFRFDPSTLTEPLNVRVFIDRNAYDSYVSARTSQSSGGAIYLHYNQKDRRELVICRFSREEAAMLPHQAFIQFLRGFIANPPAWMREGFSIYFNTLKFDPAEGRLNYTENLAWLEEVKLTRQTTGPIRSLITADLSFSAYPENFQIQSWAFVSFLLNSGNEEYFRTLIECFMLLSPAASAADNSYAVMKHMDLWAGFDAMEKDYQLYLDSRKTFNELMEEGRNAYNTGDAFSAELSFLAALAGMPTHYAPYYYLGLIYYAENNYSLADEYYRLSLSYGADEALVSYALGLNAASAGNNEEAVQWLRRSSAADPVRYRERADELIRRLQSLP